MNIVFRAFKRITSGLAGTAAIEFAFVIFPTMLLIFGSIEVARLVWVQNSVHEIAITGARCMGIDAEECTDANGFDPAATKAHIQDLARAWGLSLDVSDIDLSENATCGGATDFSRVVIRYDFTSFLTLLTDIDLGFEACLPNQN
ncbi:MAG: Flp pilus assembly protein TadG [Paracoccaceae bacterium]|jgi:Flp pilus assembly protein TadG